MKLLDVVRRINWKELRAQKRWLIAREDEHDEAGGLLNLLDHLQDAAIEDGVAPAAVVNGTRRGLRRERRAQAKT